MSKSLPLVGVWVSHAGGPMSCMVHFKAREGDLAHGIELADTYVGIEGNTRAEVRRMEGGRDGAQEVVAIRSPHRPGRRHVLARVFHGSTHSTFHFERQRMVPGPVYSSYGPNRERLTSSIHMIVNGRGGLHRERQSVSPRPRDIQAPFPYNPERPRRHPEDPRRLP